MAVRTAGRLEQQPAISVRHSIDATGAGGLEVVLPSPRAELRFDGSRSTDLALIRDWRDYHLLLFNIHGPPDGMIIEFSLHSGTEHPLHVTRRFLVKPGWNLYRFDLAELGAEIDLADVRSLRWRAPELRGPAEIYFDDFILTDNTRYLLGEDAGDGELFVQTRGRRICVGARGRFQLGFSDGVIVEWYGDNGPQNLTIATGLGPWPQPLPEDWSRRHDQPGGLRQPGTVRRLGQPGRGGPTRRRTVVLSRGGRGHLAFPVRRT